MIVWDADEILPHASVAVHVLVTLYSPAQSPGVVTSLDNNVNALLQPSDADATANVGVAGQVIVVGAGNEAMTGASTSITWMVCAVVDKLPHASIAVQVRVTLYSPAQSPKVVTSEGTRVNALPQLSEAVATANTGVAGQWIVEVTGNGAMTGASVSIT